jgi:uncharacterized protein DUF899
MTSHKTGTPEEWRTARLELLRAEKELTRRGDELARQRRELPWVRIDQVQHACCIPRNPRANSAAGSLVPGQPGAHIPRRVLKGGSHLCAPNYCLRYRPAARQGEAVDTSMSDSLWVQLSKAVRIAGR